MATSYQEYREQLLRALCALAPMTDPASGDAAARLVETIAFTRPPKPEMGDLALPAFPIARERKLPPPQVATAWAETIRTELARTDGTLAKLPVPIVEAMAAGPYVNLRLDAGALARLVAGKVVERGAAYGLAESPTGKTVMVEYSSPNTNKPLHLGHIRNNLLGMAIGNLREAAGDHVIRVSLVNDRGVHICKSMLAYARWGWRDGSRGNAEDRGGAGPAPGGADDVAPDAGLGLDLGPVLAGIRGGRFETPESTGEKGDHFVGRFYVLYNTRLNEERAAWATARGADFSLYAKAALRAIEDNDERRRREAEGEALEEAFLAASPLTASVSEMLRRWEAGDPDVLELWRTMNEWVYSGFRETYSRLGCRFDRWDYESVTWLTGKEEVERGLAAGVVYRKEDGSLWARLEPLGMADKIVLRSDGTSIYITQDIGTAVVRFRDFAIDRMIYVVGAEQEVHFRNLFATLKLLGHEWAGRCSHASYALVNLPRGLGKLKSREGTAVDADDLLDSLRAIARERIEQGGYAEEPGSIDRIAEQIGQGALKLYMLQVSSEKTIVFDPEETISFTGDTGPAVQYSHARIHGIVRKGIAAGKLSEEEFEPGPAAGGVRFLRAAAVDPSLLAEPEEREVLRLVAEFPDTVAAAARQDSPAPVANALLDLTKAYARMYHQHEVLKAEPALRRARVQLALCVAQVLQNGLRLLTIEAPERM